MGINITKTKIPVITAYFKNRGCLIKITKAPREAPAMDDQKEFKLNI